ncbi:MAG: efflux RND transporter periplasmic adaptor subunit [Pseudomonadota bacterium]
MNDAEMHPPQSGRAGWAIGLIQLVFVIGVIAASIGLSRALQMQVSQSAPQLADMRGDDAISVRIADVQTLTYTPQTRVNGTVQATAEVSVSPQVSGEIQRVSKAFRPGSEIKRGTLLFEIDRADYLLALQRAEAEIASAQSDLQQLEAEAALAIQEWKELFPGREINELAARVPQIEAAKARLDSAIANKQTSELSLQRTRVYAPVDARVMASSLDIGQIVSPGQVVGRLVALESIELAVPVSLDQLTILEPALGRQALFQRRGGNARQQTAEIVRVDATLDARTRLSNLFMVPETQDELRIGDFVDVVIEADPISGALKLPATALSGQSELWVLDGEQLSKRDITVIGETDNGAAIITRPFDIGDGVVALPPLEAKDGQIVSVRQILDVSAATGGRIDAAQ